MNPLTIKLASPDLVWRWLLRAHRHAGAASLALVLLGTAAWWFLAPASGDGKDAAGARTTRLTWIGHARGGHVISSPVLFALPTPVGFSRDALAAGIRPPPEPAASGPVNGLPDASPSAVANITRTTPQQAAVSARRLAWPETEMEPTASAASPSVVVVGQFAGTVAQPRSIPAATNSVWMDAQSWEAVARVSLDEQGWPLRVLLEKATPATNRNLQIVHLLHTMNFGTVGARDGRVAVRYEGTGARP